MKITDDMRNEGGMRLKLMADYEDDNGTGIQADPRPEFDRIRIKVDSYDPFGDTIYLTTQDVRDLARDLLVMAMELDKDEAPIRKMLTDICDKNESDFVDSLKDMYGETSQSF